MRLRDPPILFQCLRPALAGRVIPLIIPGDRFLASTQIQIKICYTCYTCLRLYSNTSLFSSVTALAPKKVLSLLFSFSLALGIDERSERRAKRAPPPRAKRAPLKKNERSWRAVDSALLCQARRDLFIHLHRSQTRRLGRCRRPRLPPPRTPSSCRLSHAPDASLDGAPPAPSPLP